ncbi:MAG TPA: ABC transporter ATP-binding protein [Syntrophomonadaceae bacterium]|nr:ABC transporter ATP-binding protein [Syntrophomonadaceae bacterium]
MLKLLRYLKPYRKAALLAPLLMLLEVAMDLLQPALMAKVVDQGIATGNLAYIIHTGLLMTGLALVGLAGGFGCMLASSIAATGFAADLRLDLFRRVQDFSFANLDRFQPSSLITRLTNDVLQVQNIVLMSMRIMIRAPFLCIGGIVMAVLINARLALILIVTIPALAAAITGIIKKGFPLFTVMQRRLDRVNSVMRENLAGVRVVKAFVRAEHEKSRFAEANRDLMEISVSASRVMALIMPLMMLMMNLSIVAVIWFGGIQVNTGGMQIGEVIAFINYLTQILFSLMMVAFILMMISRAKASADRLNEVLDMEPDIRNLPDADRTPLRTGEVVFDNVSFRYDTGKGEPVLKNISFTAHSGETVAILGATGSGKSTLVSLIPRLYEATEGRVFVDGRDVRRIDLEVLRQGIGVVLQESLLFSGTIKENLLWGNENAGDEEIAAAARAAQAHDFIMNLPEGYNTRLGQSGVNLSGGQKQRLAIARALLKKPKVLILDDSTSAVDLATEARIQSALRELAGKCTIILIAQRISSVMEADKILVLEEGRIIAQGTHAELLRECVVYRDIYESQMGKEAAVNA